MVGAERSPSGIQHKLSHRILSLEGVEELCSNMYTIELSANLQVTPTFIFIYLYTLVGFDVEEVPIKNKLIL